MFNRSSVSGLTLAVALCVSGCPADPVTPPDDAGPAGDTPAVADAAPRDSGVRDAPPIDVCGNGTVSAPRETCDDGNTAVDDGCDATCGLEAGWTCDAADPSVCTETCGDGTVVGDEAGANGCDDSDTSAGDGCGATCAVESGWSCSGEPSVCTPGCGDGAIVGSEGCDDANMADDDGCSAACQPETGFDCTGAPSICASTCGDGARASDEACDDSGAANGDGCSATCDVEAGWDCSTGTCMTTCGDGVIAGAEGCDDGDSSPGDGCSDVCQSEPGFSCAGAPSVCASTCGDAIVASDEGCDDGDLDSRDGCSATCRVEAGWNCSTGTCAPVCGDGLVVVGAEGCDDANTITETCAYGLASCTVCASNCTNQPGATSICGDGATDAANEACDDANTVSETACVYGTASCTRCDATCDAALTLTGNVCGDSVRDVAREECDDGGVATGDGCDALCQREPRCGDTFTDAPEVCDDGGTTSGDGCEANCLSITPNWEIEPNPDATNASRLALATLGHGTIGVAGDRDVWVFTLTTASDVRIETFDATGLACMTIDTVLDLLGTDGTTVLATDDEGSALPGGCSLIDPSVVVPAQSLPAGTYYVRVREFRATATGGYTLRITTTPPPVCGNGILERSQACDDGNTLDGDGCSSTCTVEPTYACSGAPSVCAVAYALIPAACIDTTAGAVVPGVTADDSTSPITALPFSLSFYGTLMTHYSVTSNGFMQVWPSAVGMPENTYLNVAIPNAAPPAGFIAPFWDDLLPGATGSARTITVGTAPSRRLVVEWRAWEFFMGVAGSSVTFQAHLLEATGQIEFHYCSMTAPSGTRHTGDSATIGAESLAGTTGTSISFDTAGAVMTGSGLRFTP